LPAHRPRAFWQKPIVLTNPPNSGSSGECGQGT
jgi:hypothetical protein